MEQQPIKIPDPITPKRFAIPLVEGLNEREAMKDWGHYTDLLRAWGFEEIASARSYSHRDAQKGYGEPRMEDYAVWAHPKGVVATLHSYSTPAYTGMQGNEVPARHALGSANFHAVVDMGCGGELQHRGSVKVHGSGGSTPLFDGRCVREISETVHSNTSETLGSFLRMIQPHGRLLPFGEWHNGMDRFHLDIPNEILIPLTQVEHTHNLPDQAALGAAFEELMKTLPTDLAGVFQEERRRAEEFRKREPGSPGRGLRWDPVEFVIDEFSEAMFLAGKRWPKPEESALLMHWSKVALGEFGDQLDPVAMRAYEQGPAGLSLAVALLYAKRTATAADGLLAQLLEQAPEEVLKRWATDVDAAGYTLGLRAVDRLFTERMIDSHEPPQTDTLGILQQRLGNDGLVMATPTRSVLGMVLEARPREGSMQDKAIPRQHADLASVVERLDEWGAQWAQHLRWRSYPNLFRDKDKPHFFQVDGVVDPGQWKTLVGDNWTQALAPIQSRLEAAVIEHGTQGVAPTARRTVRRM